MSSAPVTAVPRLIKFSGMLKDGKGEAKTGIAGVTFAIYADQEGGAALWMEIQNVTFDEAGRYTALLGAESGEGVPLALFSTGQARWLGIEGADIQQPPRVLLVSVPYALKAADAETVGGMPASAFALANPQTGSTSVTSQSGAGTGAAISAPFTSGTAASPSSKPKASRISAQATAAAVTPDADDFLAKFDATANLVPSTIFETNGNVGIGTATPLAPLHVNGNILLNGQATHSVQVAGAASTGRFGQEIGRASCRERV